MKTLKVLLQEVVSGIKAWVNSNFAQEGNTVHKTGDETINGVKTFTGSVFQNQAGGTNVYCATCDGAVKGDLTSSGTFSIVCKDGSNANMETSGLAAVYMGQNTSGSYVALRADTTYNNTRYNAAVSLDIDPTTANNNAIFRPRRDNTIDLGSSSYQFKNLYANNYYYKGTAWGLDKLNTWTGGNIFSAETYNNHVLLTNTTLDLSNGNPALSETNQGMILFTDKTKWEGKTYARLQSWTASDQTITVLAATYRPDANTESDFSVWVSNTQNMKSFHPYGVSEAHLGTSSYKWKTLNGINPGALSFPKVDSWTSGTEINAAVGIDTTNWDMTGGTWNEMTNNVQDGWVYFAFQNCSVGDRSLVRYYGTDARFLTMGFNAYGSVGAGYYLYIAFPMAKGSTVNIAFTTSGTVMSKFIYPCIGNV